jgi:TolA-binding protein
VKIKMTAATLAALLWAVSVRADDAKLAAAAADPAPAAPAAAAAPTVQESVMTFLKNLKLALTQSAVAEQRNKTNSTAAVAAVRGKDQTSDLANPDEPSIKGDVAAAKAAKLRAEDAEFEKALDLILAGKIDDGIKALETFKIKHPKSHSLPSVQEAIDKARSLQPDKPAAAPANAAVPTPAKN